MRDYKQVTQERYEQEDLSETGIEKNIYASINPIGNYGEYKENQVLKHYIRMVRDLEKKGLHKIRLLDCGCGNGLVTRLASNILGNTEHIYGFEYSRTRLDYCRKMNGSIRYEWGDVVKGIPSAFSDMRFDGIMAFVVLSHLRKRKEVLAALKNIYSALDENGLFLWYEINAKTHYCNPDADTQGFSAKEMEEHARKAGFILVEKRGLYRLISVPLINKSISTCYLADKIHFLLLEAISVLLPFQPAIHVHVYKKS